MGLGVFKYTDKYVENGGLEGLFIEDIDKVKIFKKLDGSIHMPAFDGSYFYTRARKI